MDQKVIFEELMITLAQLLSPTAELPIRQPAYYQGTGFYPTKYGVRKSGGKTYAIKATLFIKPGSNCFNSNKKERQLTASLFYFLL
ncbi:MAG: hypothetical protein JWN76_1264 [Chitinophagaceae bacterium]|nr:hypothetical protein [Chitinophagaceae bacterium]